MPQGTPTVRIAQPRKRIWHSRTLWFNLVVAALAAAEAASGVLQPLLPGNVYGWLVFALTVGNAVLRTLTVTGVCLRGAAVPMTQEQQP